MLAASFTTSRGVTTTTPILSTLVMPIRQAAVAAAPPQMATARPPLLRVQLPPAQGSMNYQQAYLATQGAAQTPSAPVVAQQPGMQTNDPNQYGYQSASPGTTASAVGPVATGVAPTTSVLSPDAGQQVASWLTQAKPYVPYVVGGLVVLGVAHFVFRHLL